MQKNDFLCPHCGHIIDLSDIARHEVDITRRELEKNMQEELRKKEEEIKKEMWVKALSAAEKKSEEDNREKLLELENLRKRDEESRKKELEFFREKATFEQKQKDMELEKERAIFEARKVMEGELSERMKQEQTLQMERVMLEYEKKMQEKDKQIEQVQRSLEDANRKASQGSMQIQGDIQENALKETLSREFPVDQVDDVPTGIKGADLIHTVRSSHGKEVGIIAWESKNTKAWSDGWVEKLKEDRLRVNAGISVIVSSVLPEGIKHFGLYKGIWITEWAYVIPLTITLREQMIVIDQMKGSLQGKDEKMEVIYSYLTSSEFKDKIENIVEAFQGMKESLDQEKRAMERIWSNREKSLDRVITNTARLYGDVQGLIGTKLETVKYFELGSGEE